MAVQYFAKVSATDHEKLQKLVKHYPASSYADWHLKEAARMAEWRARRHTIQMVPVTPALQAAIHPHYCVYSPQRGEYLDLVAQAPGLGGDAVDAVLDIDPRAVVPAPPFGTGIRADFIAGMAQQEQGFLIILNMAQVLSLEDIRHLSLAAKGA